MCSSIHRTLCRIASVAFLLAPLSCERLEHEAAGDIPPDTGETADSPEAQGILNPQQAQDEPIEDWQADLLDLAFDSASAMPLDPHIKTRSRAQELVFKASLDMGLHERALRYAEQIDNWRRGASYAAYVAHCAKNGVPCDSLRYLSLAREIAGQAEGWRADRVKNEIAAAHAWLGDSDEAEALSSNLDESETGRIDTIFAQTSDEDDFDARLEQISTLSATGNFDLVRHALFSGVALHARYYASPEKRARVEQVINDSWAKTPYNIRAEVLTAMAENALSNEDSDNALRLANSAREMIAERTWNPDDYLPLSGPIAAISYLSGDRAGGLALASESIEYYEERTQLVPNIYVAETLRPIAEAYMRMGMPDEAMALYRRVIESGVDNPNSVPRAEDLSETCTSMARHEFRPPSDLLERMNAIKADLGAPW